MQTLHSVLKRGGLFWDRALLPPSELEGRLVKLQDAIAAAGDDAWLLYGDAQQYGSMAYASHFLPRTRSAMALVPRTGAPVLLASVGERDIPASKALTWIDDVRPFTVFPTRANELLAERKLGEARIGLAGAQDSLPVAEFTVIQNKFPRIQWQNRDAELQRLRASKSAVELATIKHTAALVQSALELAKELLRPGESMRKVAALVDREIRRKGAEDARLLVASGEQVGQALRPVDDRILQAGDVVLLFVAAEYQRYWAEGAQTFVLGPASDALSALSANASEALHVMQSAARPGVAASDLADAAGAHIGQGAMLTAAEAYGLGHGIGLDLEEHPTISVGSADTLHPGATLGLHVVLHNAPLGVISGRTISVTDQGAEPLLSLAPLVECNTQP